MSLVEGNGFLNEFADFVAKFEEEDETDEVWIKDFFGRNRNTKRRDFKAHLGDQFLVSCNDDRSSFEKFKIQSGEVLKSVDRFICENCFRSRRYFCYSCYILSPQLEGKLNKIRLPVSIDIIKHSKELDGKSTSPHAAILAPQDVRIFTYPNIPDDWPNDPNRILLIFPKKGAPTVTEYLSTFYKQFTSESKIFNGLDTGDETITFNFPFDRVVFIDSTWRQTKAMINDVRFKRLPAVIIDTEETLFWRYHKRRPVHYLSTIEAIYYFCLQTHHFMAQLAQTIDSDRLKQLYPPYEGQFDNLLFFFKHTYHLIKDRYQL